MPFSDCCPQTCSACAAEGRQSWGKVVRCAKDWSRLTANYFPQELKKRAARYVQASGGTGGFIHIDVSV